MNLRLTEAEWAAHDRAERDVKDKSYRRYPLGEEVGRFLRSLRVERRSQATRDSYETTLRRLVLGHRDYESLAQFSTDDLYAFLDHHWGDSQGDTMGQRAACVRSFFAWAIRSGRLGGRNPAEAIKVPRVNRRLRLARELAEIRLLAAAQPRIGDEAAILIMGRLGLQKMEAARLQARDVDLAHDLLYIRRAKGGKPAELPLVFADVRQALALWLSEPGRKATDYLIAPERGRGRPLNQATVHRWFQRCLERVGLSGIKIHELRHSAGDRLWRETGDLIAAQQILRHESVRTTQDYLHPTADDLRARMNEGVGQVVRKPPLNQTVYASECTRTDVMSSPRRSSPAPVSPLPHRWRSDHKKVLPPAVPVGTSGGRTFAEPISLSSTDRIDFRLPATALTIGFGLLASRTRRKEDNKVVPREIQGLRSAEK